MRIDRSRYYKRKREQKGIYTFSHLVVCQRRLVFPRKRHLRPRRIDSTLAIYLGDVGCRTMRPQRTLRRRETLGCSPLDRSRRNNCHPHHLQYAHPPAASLIGRLSPSVWTIAHWPLSIFFRKRKTPAKTDDEVKGVNKHKLDVKRVRRCVIHSHKRTVDLTKSHLRESKSCLQASRRCCLSSCRYRTSSSCVGGRGSRLSGQM